MITCNRCYLVIQIHIDFVITFIRRAFEISDLKIIVRMGCQRNTITGVGTMGKSVSNKKIFIIIDLRKQINKKIKDCISYKFSYTFPPLK